MSLQFLRIEEIEHIPTNAIIDVLGVVESVEPATQITRKDGTDTNKRSLVVKDNSNRSIEVRRIPWPCRCCSGRWVLPHCRTAW